MSVIFKTLKKLQQQHSDPKGRGPKKARLGKPSTFGWLLHTPLVMGIFLGAIFIAGFVLLYGLDRISGPYREPRGPALTAMVEKRLVEPSKVSSGKVQANELQSSFATEASAKVLPPAPSEENYERGTLLPSNSELLGRNPSNRDHKHSDTIRHAYLKSSEKLDSLYSESVDAPSRPIINDPSITVRMDRKDAALDEKIKELNGVSYSPALTSNDPEHRNTSIMIPAVSGIKHDLSQDNHQLLKEDDGLSKRAVVTAIQAPDPKQKQHLANLEKLRRAAKKRANIAKLVTRLEGAVLRMDAPEVKKLMRRLSAAKGEDNLYVLNLKAFWYLKQKRYFKAEALLKKILKIDQDHLEAGLNMAVVEVKTQRSDTALKRLKRLKALYPENPVLVEMIQKLS